MLRKEVLKMVTEIKILDFIQTIRTPVGDMAMKFIPTLGNGGIIWIATAIILLCIPKKRKSGLILIAAICIDVVLCNGILKNLIARIRPCDINTAVQLLVARPLDYSFPSGHTAASFAAVSALFFCKERKIMVPALVLACLMAFSRLYLYVHYPTDILGGILVGTISGWLAYIVVEKKLSHQKNIKIIS